MSMLRRIRRSPRATVQPIIVTLYGRDGCHLCKLAEKPLARAVTATRGATLHHVDIDTDDALRDRYGHRIPVVTVRIDDVEQVIAEGKVSDIRLRRSLATLGAGR